MTNGGYENQLRSESSTYLARFTAWRERHRIHLAATLAVVVSVTFIVAELVPPVQDFVSSRGFVEYLTLIVLLDVAASLHLLQQPRSTSLASNQDESMTRLIEAARHCRSDGGADLLEYAGQTTLPLIREIRRKDVPLRLLVKHPDTVTGNQRLRMITTLDTLYNSVFADYAGRFEIRCYRLPYTLRGRRLGRELLELGWLTPDMKRQTAYGHANPSVLADLSTKSNEHLLRFFERTFDDLWNDEETEDGRSVLERLGRGEP